MQHLELTAVALNRNAACQAEAEAPSALFGGKPGAEHRTANLGRHALAAVFDVDHHAIAQALNPDRDAPPLVGKGIDRVPNEVFKDPAQEHGLVAHRRQSGFELVAQVHALGKPLLQVDNAVFHKGRKVGHFARLVGSDFGE